MISPPRKRWHLPAMVALAVVLAVTTMLGVDHVAPVAQSNKSGKEIVVARTEIKAGQKLSLEMLALERRPISSLPQGAVESLEQLVGKVSVSPIPAGSALSDVLVVDQAIARGDPPPDIVAVAGSKPDPAEDPETVGDSPAPKIPPTDPVHKVPPVERSMDVVVPVKFDAPPPGEEAGWP